MSGRDGTIDPQAMRDFGAAVDFGRTAADYAAHRAGFPHAFFDLLRDRGFARPGQRALDLGCGTGSVARGLALTGLEVTGLDPAQRLLDQAKTLDARANVSVTYVCGTAEAPPFSARSFDLITAGQCWHWFDRASVAAWAAQLLRPGGRMIIAHFDWLPLPGTVVAATEALILAHNPDWAGAGGSGIYPDWLADLARAGFAGIETASFDLTQPYSHAAWRGRIRASAGISASLDAAAVTRFDSEHAALLARKFPVDLLQIPHRVWLVTGQRTRT
ncbi:class I SAM-dependent methyltransferase [Roseovarius sp. CAU 1744]|uniref:class I SAM-dependent methyltransferase n=1 Tax=Roseovarius sp. CAU 1744 TaxID=3140368 RepID=UPI00325C1803